jgi:hypothetical protein
MIRFRRAAVVSSFLPIMGGCAAGEPADDATRSSDTLLLARGQTNLPQQHVAFQARTATHFTKRPPRRECGQSLGGVFKLTTGDTSWSGDVVLTTQAEADALACVTEIDGNLTVRPTESVVRLPALQEVSGDVLIEVNDTTAGDFSTAERADLPALTTIGGTLHFHHLMGGYGSTVELGLPALTALAGDLDLVLSSFNGDSEGLAALASVAGNLTITAVGDLYVSDLLPALTQVQGDVLVQSNAGSSGYILNQLESVGGTLELISLSRLAQPSFDNLTAVGGDLRMAGVYSDVSRFPSLSDVGGTLALDGDSAASIPATALIGSAGGLSIGALRIDDTSRPIVPLPAATQLSPTGSVVVTDNALMCQASVDAFIAAREAEGWTGPLTVSGNTGPCAP